MVSEPEKKERGKWIKANAPKGVLSELQIKNYDKRKAMAQSFTPADINKRIMSLKNVKYRVICAVAFLTASRISEVCTLKRGDVELNIYNSKPSYTFTIRVEKRREKVTKDIPITIDNPLRQEFAPLVETVKNYLKAIWDFSSDSYLFGDPGYTETKRTYKLTRKTYDEEGNEKEIRKKITKPFYDIKLRMAVYTYCMRNAGFNPHLLRHAMLSYLVSTPLLKEYDRVFWIRTLAGWKSIDSAASYVGQKGPKELATVL